MEAIEPPVTDSLTPDEPVGPDRTGSLNPHEFVEVRPTRFVRVSAYAIGTYLKLK